VLSLRELDAKSTRSVESRHNVSELIMVVAEGLNNCYNNHGPTYIRAVLPTITTHVLPDTKLHDLITKSQSIQSQWDSSNGHKQIARCQEQENICTTHKGHYRNISD
jgi:hypothetical protein